MGRCGKATAFYVKGALGMGSLLALSLDHSLDFRLLGLQRRNNTLCSQENVLLSQTLAREHVLLISIVFAFRLANLEMQQTCHSTSAMSDVLGEGCRVRSGICRLNPCSI